MNPALFDALRILTQPDYFGLSCRRINVSTVGIVPGIQRLTRDFPQVNLAVSIHSPFPEQRAELMPVTKSFPLGKVLNTVDAHVAATKRKVWLAMRFIRAVLTGIGWSH